MPTGGIHVVPVQIALTRVTSKRVGLNQDQTLGLGSRWRAMKSEQEGEDAKGLWAQETVAGV